MTTMASDVAGMVSSMLLEKQLKLSPMVAGYDESVPISSKKSASPIPTQPTSSTMMGDLNSSSSTAASGGLLQLLQGKQSTGGRCGAVTMASHQVCNETVPRPPHGTHIHHHYVDDLACLGDEPRNTPRFVSLDGLVDGLADGHVSVGGWRGVSPVSLGSLNSSSGEEELRIRERRETRVSLAKKQVKEGRAHNQ